MEGEGFFVHSKKQTKKQQQTKNTPTLSQLLELSIFIPSLPSRRNYQDAVFSLLQDVAVQAVDVVTLAGGLCECCLAENTCFYVPGVGF